MPRAVSKIFSAIATYPSAAKRNPTAAEPPPCHPDGVALVGHGRSLRSAGCWVRPPKSAGPSVDGGTVGHREDGASSGELTFNRSLRVVRLRYADRIVVSVSWERAATGEQWKHRRDTGDVGGCIVVISQKAKLAVLALSIALLSAACVRVSQIKESPATANALEMISAGHTGCQPADNRISNIHMELDGNGTWNATCNDKTYLCSAFKGVNPSDTYSCALAVRQFAPDHQ